MSINDGKNYSNTEINLANKIHFEENKKKLQNPNIDKNKRSINIKNEINKFNSKLTYKKAIIRKHEQSIVDKEKFRLGI